MNEEKEALNSVINGITEKSNHDNLYRQLQSMSYRSGYYAALSEIINRLMQMQGEKIRTPYDQQPEGNKS